MLGYDRRVRGFSGGLGPQSAAVVGGHACIGMSPSVATQAQTGV